MVVATIKVYHEDPAARQFAGRVLSCRSEGPHWLVVLDRTAFYAAAGGQPHDTGELGGRSVLEVTENEETGEIIHRVDGPLSGEVTGQVDWDRRRDHVEQHTGQHLLSQSFVHLLAAETLSFHLGAESSTIDLDVENLEPEQVTAVEDLANGLIRENRPVLVHWAADAAEARERFPLRKPPAVAERVRVVEIGGFDWSACGGTHVAGTGELGLLKVKSWERYKKTVRVTFLAGGRALRDYQALDAMTRTLCRELSIGPADLPGQVQRFRDEAQRLRKQLRDAQEKLLEAEALELLAGARTISGARLVKHVFLGRTPEEIKALAAAVAAHPKAVALFASRGAMPQLVFSRSVDLRLDMGAVLRQVLPAIQGRGGGSPVNAQGAGTYGEGVPTALDAAAAAVAQALHG